MSNKKTGKRFQSEERAQKNKASKTGRDPGRDRRDERDSKTFPRESRSDRKTQNDPKWYYRDEETLRAYANYPFNLPAGFGLRIDGGIVASVDGQYTDPNFFTVPGIMVNNYLPWIGDARDAADPINLAAQSVYTYVRSANSGGKNYEPTDIAIYLVAMDSLYAAYTCMIRAYGTLYAYNTRNRYMPKALFEAQGFDYNDFVSHIADFKAYIDLCRTRISQMVVPSGMTYFQRHTFLNASIFADSSVAKSQFILFKPEYLWMYEGYEDMKGGKVTLARTGFVGESPSELMTFAELRELVDTLISRVVNDVDCGVISGDLLKAYGSNIYLLPSMPADYSIAIQPMDAMMASQLHNAIYVGHITGATIAQSITDDPNVPRLIYSNCEVDTHQLTSLTILDVSVNDPTPHEVLEATRFVYRTEYDDVWGATRVKAAASEILTTCQLINLDRDLGQVSYLTVQTLMPNAAFISDAIQWLATLNIAPILYFYADGEANTYYITNMYGYLDNCVNFDMTKLDGLNTMVLDTMFTTDMSGKYNSK